VRCLAYCMLYWRERPFQAQTCSANSTGASFIT